MKTKGRLFSDKQKLRESITSKSAWQKILNEVLHGWKKTTSDGNLYFQEELKGTGNARYMSKYKSTISNLNFYKIHITI